MLKQANSNIKLKNDHQKTTKTIKNKNNTLKIWFVPFNFCYFADV